MQAQKEAPPDMQCRDKFLLQSVVVSPGSSAKDITAEMVYESSLFTLVLVKGWEFSQKLVVLYFYLSSILYFYSIFQFSKDSGNQVDECKLRVTYVPPQQPPSPVREGSEEGSPPRASVSEDGTVNQASDSNMVSIVCCSICFSSKKIFQIKQRSNNLSFSLWLCRCQKDSLKQMKSHQRLYYSFSVSPNVLSLVIK